MPCAECRVFDGDPTCGACKAVVRIIGLLRAGTFQAGQQRRVTEILRSAAGELTDLVEANQGTGSKPEVALGKEGTTGLTSGPPEPPAKKEGENKESAKSEYSYTEEEIESEATETDQKVEEGPPDAPGETSGQKREQEEAPTSPNSPALDGTARAEALAKRRAKFDPHYLTKRLCLTAAPKPHSRSSKETSHKRARGDSKPRSRGREGQEGSVEAQDRPRPLSEGGRHDEDSEGREPLPRRPREAPRSQGKARGRKKRERTREFRAKKIEERRAKKAERDRQWPPKQKRKHWGEQKQWRS